MTSLSFPSIWECVGAQERRLIYYSLRWTNLGVKYSIKKQNNRPLKKLEVMNASLKEEEDKMKAHALYAHDIEWAKRESLKNVENGNKVQGMFLS